MHANLIRACKRQRQEDGLRVFASSGERKQREKEARKAESYTLIGCLRPELLCPKPAIGESFSYD